MTFKKTKNKKLEELSVTTIFLFFYFFKQKINKNKQMSVKSQRNKTRVVRHVTA